MAGIVEYGEPSFVHSDPPARLHVHGVRGAAVGRIQRVAVTRTPAGGRGRLKRAVREHEPVDVRRPSDVQCRAGSVGVDSHAAGGVDQKLIGASASEEGRIRGVGPDECCLVIGLGAIACREAVLAIGAISPSARHGPGLAAGNVVYAPANGGESPIRVVGAPAGDRGMGTGGIVFLTAADCGPVG